MRPCIGMSTRRSRTIRATSATTIGANAARPSAIKTLARFGEPRSSVMPLIHENRREAFEQALDEQHEAAFNRRRLRAHQERRKLGAAEHDHRFAIVARCASTTMKANETGSASRIGGRNSISSPSAIALPITARATHELFGTVSATAKVTAPQPPARISRRAERLTGSPLALR